MWNSTSRTNRRGKRYTLEDIRALVYPLDKLMDFLDSMPVANVVDERFLHILEKNELIYGIYEVLQSLLTDVPIPKGGHPGYHEAIVAELLNQTFSSVSQELEDSELGTRARKTAWASYLRLCSSVSATGEKTLILIEDLKLDLEAPNAHESPKITREIWQDILIGDTGLRHEFLWDDDWRMDYLMDLPQRAAKSVSDMAGIDLSVVHRLPHTPSEAEQRMAEYYIRYAIWADEVIEQRPPA